MLTRWIARRAARKAQRQHRRVTQYWDAYNAEQARLRQKDS